ncbi:acyl-CoA dehydrogenase C-terminal domain-containing protein [Wenxinia saemankumensis]|uniref:3-methylmercaptopropionyl-CoA dehydrogenase n=1 Tax=Wenxinia saemankumensis TaxID=1447782 RepID=A0A1M6CUZ8_9RHOB|nr:acyl-CoA dehydrogenase C-terminal domain-containing protein [Wenxinia saemankumensis]SHI64713.1 acyl-CoA dehydrogenase/hypothetical protein [Wenxinia saemankumensis]
MPTYTAPTQDIQFLLHDILDIAAQDIPGYSDLDRDFTAAIVEEAGKLAANVILPTNRTGDQQGCRLENGVVRVPDGFREAFDALREGGWTALDCDEAYGGQGLPAIMRTASNEAFVSANMALNMYQGLTHGAYLAIHKHGTDAQKDTFLPKLVSCQWTGTMNLTEAHCGTDLGLMRTKAEPQEDGTYRISGEKIFISSGEHEMADNIVHLVLAKIPGGPDGVKGISLFIVPKFLVNEDGSLGDRNGVRCTGLEEKMGIHGNSTCVMTYEGATGYLLGAEHKGMRAMFTMMNDARAGVGLQGLSQAAIAYQNALAYAQDRLQGRDITGAKQPDAPADPIIVHPDVRRSLMEQKSFVEGGRAFAMWASMLLDRAERTGDEATEGLVSLLTPVIKGFLTDKGYEYATQAQQIYGGHGYIEEWGMSQYVRDARIAMIYEGTNGVQALDLVGRKLASGGGRHAMAFFDHVKGFLKEAGQDDELSPAILDPLKAASKDLQAAAMFFMQQGPKDPNAALAGSTDFLHMFGHVCLGLMWGRMAVKAKAMLEAGEGDADFLRTKIATARFYGRRQLPLTGALLKRIESGSEPVMALEAANF